MGGKDIATQNAGDFAPAIFVMDVTNPRDPKVMWDNHFQTWVFSTNTPAIIRVNGEWMLVVSSGPQTTTLMQ